VAVDMSTERFEELVADALDTIPEALMSHLDNVVVLLEDDPPDDNPHLLGLYEGIDLTRRGWAYAGALPDRIFIFRNPILEVCDTDDDVIEQVAVTVVHEIAHHFGIDDSKLDELGWG
jgi:predicted Zn-dependent protease with MMP-like domain